MEAKEEMRLENFEKMYQAVLVGLEDANHRMADLSKMGKNKTATYRQLMVQKLTYKNMLDMYRLFGID